MGKEGDKTGEGVVINGGQLKKHDPIKSKDGRDWWMMIVDNTGPFEWGPRMNRMQSGDC